MEIKNQNQNQNQKILPEDFDWKTYLYLNPDLNIIIDEVNKSIDTAVLIHVGNYDVFENIYNTYTDFFNKLNVIIFITVHNEENKNKIQEILPYSIITIIENKGSDIGGYLNNIKQLINYKNYNNINYIYFIHTKLNDLWRNNMLKSIIKNEDKIKLSISDINLPIIISSDDYCFNNKCVNKYYIKEFYERNKKKINTKINFNNFMDEYIFENDDLNNLKIINELDINYDFYKYYEEDLKKLNNEELINHYTNFGINEYHRIFNQCYITKFGLENYFSAGTIFMCNKEYLKIFEKIDLDYEFSILENGYNKNTIPLKTHSWEYMFGLFAYSQNGYIISVNNSNHEFIPKINYKNKLNLDIYRNCNPDLVHLNNTELINHYINFGINENRIDNLNKLIKIQSQINIDCKKARIAFFMIIPTDSLSGGYRTLLKYIQSLVDNNIHVDLYFGYDINSIKTYNGLSILNTSIQTIIEIVNSYNELNMNSYNFYLGYNVQRNYDIICANAWQTSEAVYLNKHKSKHICYVIQDLEYLFTNDIQLQLYIKKQYKEEFKYFCITKYLTKFFKNLFPTKIIFNSILGSNQEIYFNKNEDREKSIIIAYYKNKIGRLPELIEKIIEKLSKLYKCYIYPDNYEKEESNTNIINLGTLQLDELNDIYNKCTIGIVMSNTNPSRLGYEMLMSGLKVIEYNSEYTKYDMPNEYFTKIKSEKNIEKVVEMLFNKTPYDIEKLNTYLESIDVNKELENINLFFNILLDLE
jgi:hypothetical protein